MYVCVCHALKECDVRDAKAGGASKASEVFGHFGVTQKCGRSVPALQSMIGTPEPAGERRHATDGVPLPPSGRRDGR